MDDIKELDRALIDAIIMNQAFGNTTISVPSGYVVDPLSIWENDGNMIYDNTKDTKLKVKCWVCQKDLDPYQMYDFSIGKERISLKCCGREQVIHLTEEEIKRSNESGVYYAFMI